MLTGLSTYPPDKEHLKLSKCLIVLNLRRCEACVLDELYAPSSRIASKHTVLASQTKSDIAAVQFTVYIDVFNMCG